MKIETKYNIGNKVFFIQNNTVHQGVIGNIDVHVSSNGYTFEQNEYYDIECYEKGIDKKYNGVNLKFVYPTKEELLKSL